MATIIKEYDASWVRDFNTTSTTGTTQTLTANPRIPSRLLTNDTQTSDPITGSGVIANDTDVTDYRFTFEVDADEEVIPFSTIGVEYSTDGGTTWSNFYDDTDLAESGYSPYYAYVDEGADGNDAADPQEFIAIQSTHFSTGESTAFVLSNLGPVSDGDEFIVTEDPFGTTQSSEFLGICFTTGMELECDNGARKVEDLEIGDFVRTMDHGLQPVRAIFRRKVPAVGSARPVIFEAGSIGNDKPVIVSQRHRMFTRNFIKHNDKGHLVEAIELANGTTIRLATELKEVEYFHIMFDRHELVYCHGTISESWQPHRRNLRRDKALREELMSIFPELDKLTASNGGGVVREQLKLVRTHN